jgi:hypothetical protein
LGEIQEKVIKKGKRNTVSRLFHAKIDKETITAWKSDLGKVLLIFNVRSVVVVWLLLTVYSQTELALNTHTIVSGIDHNVANTHTMVSDIHHIMVNGKDTSVSIACTLSIA